MTDSKGYKEVKDHLSKTWKGIFGFNNTVLSSSGENAIRAALCLLKSKSVAIPTYTCESLYTAPKSLGMKSRIIDCGLDLQIKSKHVVELYYENKIDTVIVPHMFGIQADIEYIRDNTTLKIIEDCSQCMGLENLGKYSDVLIASLGITKWLPLGQCGIITTNDPMIENIRDSFQFNNRDLMLESCKISETIDERLNSRRTKAHSLEKKGYKFIKNNRPSAWMRGMFFLDEARTDGFRPYNPIHQLHNSGSCPTVDSYSKRITWKSIFP